jgi:uncharacterized protein (TIGR02266 family)
MKAVIALVDSNSRTEKRTPVTLKIKFKSETIEQFIERYAVDVSKGGIFVRTKEPLAVGTTMKFEFQLKDTTTLIAGEGTVVWTRENDTTRPNVAPGMGVRFDKLAEGSQVVLDKILFEKSKGVAARSAETKPPSYTELPTRAAPPQPSMDASERPERGPVRITDPGEFNDAPTRVGFVDAPTRVSMLGEMEAQAGRQDPRITISAVNAKRHHCQDPCRFTATPMISPKKRLPKPPKFVPSMNSQHRRYKIHWRPHLKSAMHPTHCQGRHGRV